MRTVPRHEIDQEFASRQVEAITEKILEDDLPEVGRDTKGVKFLFTSAMMAMRYQCALDPTATKGPTWESVTLAMQAGSALFAAGLRSAGTVEVRIHTSVVTVPATGPQSWTNVGYWLRALYLAMICREKERTDLLCSVTSDFLRASAMRGRADAYVYPWAESLRMFWHREPGHYDRLGEALRLADPEDPNVLDQEAMGLQYYPPLVLFNYLLTGEHDRFNDALFQALEWHRSYWTRTPERARDCDGYIALAPLAMTCLAHEMGVPVEVESEYIPQGLVDGGWVGEFVT